MQVAHQYKATVQAPAAHPAAVEHHGLMDWAALGIATMLIFGLPPLAVFVAWRAFRWFFRATR